MTVKTIFKVLLGTTVGMVLSMIIIELFNISVVSFQIKQLSKMAARQACILFTQETYKTDGTMGTVNMPTIKDDSGDDYVSGAFYTGDSPEAIWTNIYMTDKFRNWCASSGLAHTNACNYGRGCTDKKHYYGLGVIKLATSGSSLTPATVTWDAGEDVLYDNSIIQNAIVYKNNLYTAANVGIPYLDKDIINTMYKWNLAKLLTGGYESAAIQSDDSGRKCVNYRGFKVYVNEIGTCIDNFAYKVYDMEADKTDILNDLNINTSNMKIINSDARKIFGVEINDNKKITSVEIDYSIVVSYEGITPLRDIMKFVLNSQVHGYSKGDAEAVKPDYSGEASFTGLAKDSSGYSTGAVNISNKGIMGTVTSTSKLRYVLAR